MKKIVQQVIATFFLTVFLLPATVSAQLVTCDGTTAAGKACNFCELINTGNNVLEFFVAILVIILTISLAITGLKMAASRGNSDEWSQLKQQLTNVVIGLLLIFASWTLVDTLLKILIVDSKTMSAWDAARTIGLSSSELCFSMVTPTILSDPDGGSGSGSTENLGPTSPSGDYAPTGGGLVEYAGAKFDPGIVAGIKHIAENYNLRVSGGHRTPERNAAVNGSPTSYHLSGRAGDFVGPRESMEAARDWANANGAREAFIHNAGTGTHLHVAW